MTSLRTLGAGPDGRTADDHAASNHAAADQAANRHAVKHARLGDLRTRAVSAVVLVALALGSTWLGGVAFALVWLAAALAISWEWQRLIGGRRLGARVAVGVAGLVVLAAALRVRPGAGTVLAVLVPLALAEALLAAPARRAWAAAGAAYAGLALVAVYVLRASPVDGALALGWLFATVWATDVFAYFGGRLIGGPKLWPRVSPSKTWSGTLTGVAAGGACGTALALAGAPGHVATPVLLLSLFTAALSQGGDAFESAMKRRFGVKDSGRLIPGHGGVMDRLDGFVAAAVFALGVGWARGLPSVALGLFQW